MKKHINRILSAALALSLLLTACGGGASASSMRLRKTDGTVRVSDDAGKDLEVRQDLSLYSGYDLRTREESYAWVDLDEVKLTKLDQDSRAEIEKEGKDLTIRVREGSLFFHVTESLAEDETLTIRVSTMAVGIRGTCGWVEALEDGGAMRVYLLEGKVECTAGEETETVMAGETALLTEDGEITVSPFTRADIPGYVLEEIEDEEAFLEDLPEGGGTGAAAGFVSWAEAGLEDHVMDWRDPGLAALMAETTGISGDIMLSDVWEMQMLFLDCYGHEPIRDIQALAELKNLGALSISFCQGIDISPLREMPNLYGLYLDHGTVKDLTPLSEMTQLIGLTLDDMQLSDLEPLRNLTSLKHLVLSINHISDLSPLRGMTALEDLSIDGCSQVSDVSPLGELTSLSKLSLVNNQIRDVSPLRTLTGLEQLNLSLNPITDYSPVEFVPNLSK